MRWFVAVQGVERNVRINQRFHFRADFALLPESVIVDAPAELKDEARVTEAKP